MRIVVDTNIFVSFAILPNNEFQKLFDYIAEHAVFLVSEDTVADLFTILNREKFRKYTSKDSASNYAECYAAIAETVVVNQNVVACRNPKDDKFLSLAVVGKADCVLAEDKDLLDMVAYEGILVYRPGDFLKLFVRE